MLIKLLQKIEAKLTKPHINWLATFWINFRLFPFTLAFKMPIYCYNKMNIRALNRGGVKIKSDKRGNIKIGFDLSAYRKCGATTLYWAQNSVIEFGENIIISQGVAIICSEGCHLKIGSNSMIGDRSEIICKKEISIGEHVDVTWDCQVTDFGSHPIVDKTRGKIKNLFIPVVINDYCWIGNRTSIERGTKLPHHTIVAQNSLLNKDYIDIGIKSFSLIGGQPAKLILENIERIYDIQEEYRIFAECWKNENFNIKI